MKMGYLCCVSLDLVTEIAGNRFLEAETWRRAQGSDRWRDALGCVARQKLFPDLFTDMMAVGEQTGHFAETMQAIADVYERELDDQWA